MSTDTAADLLLDAMSERLCGWCGEPIHNTDHQDVCCHCRAAFRRAYHMPFRDTAIKGKPMQACKSTLTVWSTDKGRELLRLDAHGATVVVAQCSIAELGALAQACAEAAEELDRKLRRNCIPVLTGKQTE